MGWIHCHRCRGCALSKLVQVVPRTNRAMTGTVASLAGGGGHAQKESSARSCSGAARARLVPWATQMTSCLLARSSMAQTGWSSPSSRWSELAALVVRGLGSEVVHVGADLKRSWILRSSRKKRSAQSLVGVCLVERFGSQCLLIRGLGIMIASCRVERPIRKTVSSGKSAKHDRRRRGTVNSAQSIALLCGVVDGFVHVQAGVLGMHSGQRSASNCVSALHAAELVMCIARRRNQADSTTVSPGKEGFTHATATGVRLYARWRACPADPNALDQSDLGVGQFVLGTSKLFEPRNLVHKGQC